MRDSIRLGRLAALLSAAILAGCASVPAETAKEVPSLDVSKPAWVHYKLPGKAASLYARTRHDGREALSATADSAASMLRRQVRVEPDQLGSLRFSWQVAELLAQADLARRESEDSPVRVILAFEGDRSRFSARDSMVAELARTITGEEMPYATLMYVWCNKREPGAVIRSSRTDRIRKIVVESGAGQLNRWLDYERDIRADFERAFGEAPGALVGVAIMTDSDNTRSRARAWYGPVTLVPAPSGNPF